MRLLTALVALLAAKEPPSRPAAAAGLDPTEVTVAAYARCVSAGACTTEGVTRSDWGRAELCTWGARGKENHPMNCVDQAQAARYCRWAGGHLPSDAEWERGALADRSYPWGEAAVAGQLCYSAFDQGGTCEVGRHRDGASPEGRLDLAGNVAEWTSTPAAPSAAGVGARAFIDRGGAWGGGWSSSLPERFGHLRGADEGARRGSYLGFRCASGPADAPDVAPAAAPRAPVVKVELEVLTTADDEGNERWTQAWVEQVLARATGMVHGEVRFELEGFERVAEDELYRGQKQAPILDWLLQRAVLGRVLVAISSPKTSDTAGFAREGSGTKDFKPHLVMRSRKNDGSDADAHECAAVFLHELGHTLGYAHDGTTAAMPWPTDGWWDFPPARERLAILAGWFELHERGAGDGARQAFTCKIGAPVPETDQLYEPPTNAPTPAECAQRCLDWPGCVATAQPTWENARCFLYGPGAVAARKDLKNHGWNNVDMCWRRTRPERNGR